jgi:hypothetical protein
MLQIGLCVPDSCSEEDAVLLFNTGKIQLILIMASVILPIFHLQYNISLIFYFFFHQILNYLISENFPETVHGRFNECLMPVSSSE